MLKEHRYRLKSIMMLIVTTGCCLLASSCSPDGDGGEETLKSISFGSSMQPVTAIQKSAGLESYATNFKVWSYKNLSETAGSYGDLMTVIEGYQVSYTAASAGSTTTNVADWEYVGGGQTIKYWDYTAKAYRFAGIAPANAAVTVTSTASALNISMAADATTAEKIAAVPYYSALWFASDKARYGGLVQMQFKKPFSRVRFIFTYADDVNPAQAVLSDISLAPADASKIGIKGNVTVSYPLTGTATAETMTINSVDASSALTAFTEPYEVSTLTYATELEKWYTVLPKATQSAYIMTLNLNGIEKTATVPAQYMTWLPNYEYTYIFKITDLGLQFIDLVGVGITNWISGDPIEHPVYNW